MMTSYAQNGEDVMLSRVFGGSTGCYVDVGANHPVVHNVTLAFYERGWRGLNIEPQAGHHEQLCALRPHDTNVRAVVSDREGEVDFFEVHPWNGLSTMDATIAERYRRLNVTLRPSRVPTVRLDSLLRRHLQGRAIDFMSIDVEGAELQVLRGLDLSLFRPSVLLIEAMAPARQEDVSGPVVAHLCARGYESVYEDGLNRFYLAEESAGLRGHFRYPPNPFDEFERHEEVVLGRELAAARARIAALEAKVAALGQGAGTP